MRSVMFKHGNVIKVPEGNEQQLTTYKWTETITVQEQISEGTARLELAWKEADKILRTVRARKVRPWPQ